MKLHKQFLFLVCILLLGSCSDDIGNKDVQTLAVKSASLIDMLTTEDKTHFSDEELAEMEAIPLELSSTEKQLKSGNTIYLPAGSKDRIQHAIHSIPDGGRIVLNAGKHYNSGTIHIHDKKVRLIGLGTTELIIDTQPTDVKGYVYPGIHIKHADFTQIMNINISPKGDIGGTGIFIQGSDKVMIYGSSITDHEFGVLVNNSEGARIYKNRIEGHPRGLASNLEQEVHGIMIVNGKEAIVVGNTLTNHVFGAWLCDAGGRYFSNKSYENFIGSILCNIPQYIPLKDGSIIGSKLPATNWTVMNNRSYDNVYTGYSITDGSNGNYMSRNASKGNGAYDIEVMGDTHFFGFFTPTAKNNQIVLGSNQTIKDCAENTKIYNSSRGVVVDTGEDGCPE